MRKSGIEGMTVIQLKNGVTVETINSDEDYRTGEITAKVVNRVRIVWEGTNEYIYVDLGMLRKVDKDTFVYDGDTPDNWVRNIQN